MKLVGICQSVEADRIRGDVARIKIRAKDNPGRSGVQGNLILHGQSALECTPGTRCQITVQQLPDQGGG